MEGFETLERELKGNVLSDVDCVGGYLTFVFQDGTVIEVVGENNSDVEINVLM